MDILIVGLSENSSMRGVERYTFELVNSLKKEAGVNICLLCGAWQDYYSDLGSNNVEIKKINVHNSKLVRHLWHYLIMPFHFKGFDIVHIVNTNPILFKLGKQVIVTIHDLAEYFVPEKYGFVQRYYRRWVSWLVSRVCSHILTDSHYSKNTIVTRLNVPGSKVTAIYLGVDHFNSDVKEQAYADNQNDIAAIGPGDYFLYWGVIEKSKGVIEVIQSFQLLILENERLAGLKLVICGRMGNARDEVEAITKNDRNIILTGHVSDSVLQYLCVRAKAIIFPSRYEGFGLPALEGFIFNDNVIASKTTSLGEITRDFAWQVDPESIEDIKNAMESVLKKPKVFTEIQRLVVLDGFIWARSAEKTFEIYGKIVACE